MRWKDKSNMTDITLAGSDVLPITDVSTDQDKKITISIIATWVVTKFTTSVAGASQTIVSAINAVRLIAQDGVTRATAAQTGVNANTEAIATANGRIDNNASGISENASNIATLNQTMENTNAHVDDLGDQVTEMQEQIDTALEQVDSAISEANSATQTASEAAATVQEIIDQGGMVLSVFGRAGVVEAQAGDYLSTQITHGTGTVADALAFDATPVYGSTKAVQSGGVFAQLNNKVDKTAAQLNLDTTAAAGTVDGDLYAAITALGWQSEVID